MRAVSHRSRLRAEQAEAEALPEVLAESESVRKGAERDGRRLRKQVEELTAERDALAAKLAAFETAKADEAKAAATTKAAAKPAKKED